MNDIHTKTSTQANYRILGLTEQMVSVLPVGTALGVCDLIGAMFSGYFIESGGAVMPAVAAYLRERIEEEKELEARSRRAAKALTYGSYNLQELIDKVWEIVQREGKWQPIMAGTKRIVSVDCTGYRRTTVKGLKSKAYFSDRGRAVPAVVIGMIAVVGEVNGQRVALLRKGVVGNLKENDGAKEKARLYKQVAKELQEDEIAVFDAGFKLVGATSANIEQCVIRLAKNCTFGKTAGKIPGRRSERGRNPTQYRAEIVRPLARIHGGKEIPATKADEIHKMKDEKGREIEVHIWHKVYFLERHLSEIEDERKRNKLRHTPLKVIAIYHPDYDQPLLLGTPILSLTPKEAYQVYIARWPVEGLPQTGKYILSGGSGIQHVHHPTAMERLPMLSLIFGSLLKYVAATLPPFRTGFWDRRPKPTYGRLLRHLKKVGIPLSRQLCKKRSVTSHLPVGYEAIRLVKT